METASSCRPDSEKLTDFPEKCMCFSEPECRKVKGMYRYRNDSNRRILTANHR
jgi:hypothetical protein